LIAACRPETPRPTWTGAAPRLASRPVLVVLVVCRSAHEARAALAPGGV